MMAIFGRRQTLEETPATPAETPQPSPPAAQAAESERDLAIEPVIDKADGVIKARIEEASGIPTVPTSTAVLQALELLGAAKLSVATPYPETMTRMVGEYLEGNGFEVLALEGRAHASHLEIGADPDDAIVDFVCQAVAPDCDAVFLSCTNWNSMGVAQRLEEQTGKPVVTSNQATIWSTLRTLGIKQLVEGYGRLLEM